MRIRELRLVAYGPFTDEIIDFGEPGECDLHIVLGLNEAGKSSARRAIHALLFGFPHITQDAHVHPYDRLRVGAVLANRDEQSVELARVKARQRDLRDAKDEPLDDGVLRHLLGGIDGALYSRLFLVDHEELRQGGAGLLAGGGDLGVSLFGATLAAGNITEVRRDLQKRSETLFKSDGKARKPLLNAALYDYRKRMEQARGLSVKPREYESAANRVDELTRKRHENTGKVAALEGEERALQRLASVTGPLARRQTVIAELDALADLPVLAQDATTRREVALETRERASSQLESSNAALEDLRGKIAGVVVPNALLERAAEIQALAGEIALHKKALRDRDNRSRELAAQEEVTAQLRTRLGSTAPENPTRVDHALRTSIEKLGDDQPILVERERVARERLQGRDEAHKRAVQVLENAATPPEAPDTITMWTAAAAELVPVALAASGQKAAVERAISKLMATAGAQSPPFDPRTRPPVAPPPAAVIVTYKSQVSELETRVAEERAERNRLVRQRDQLHIQLAALGAEQVESTREQMVTVRGERNQRFALLGDHLKEADLDGAREAQEQLGVMLTKADDLADMLLTQAEQVARRDHLTAEIAEIVKQHGERENDITGIAARREQLLATWRELWEPCGIAPLDDADAMLTWRERYDELGAQHTDLVLQLTEHEGVLVRAEETAASLHAALDATGRSADRDLPLEQLVAHARLIVERAESEIAAHDQVVADADAAAKDLVEAQRALQQAEKELKDWTSRWGEALKPLAISAAVPPAEVRTTIALLDELAVSEKAKVGFAHRIESITADFNAFANAVGALAATVGPDLRESDALELIRALNRRLETAKTAAANRTRLEDAEHTTLTRITELEGELRDAEGVLSRLCDQAKCGTAAELPAIEEQVRTRDSLRNELVELDRRIVEDGEQTVEDLLQLLGNRTGDDLAAELAAHHDSLQVARSELEALVEEHTEAIAALRQLDHGTEAAIEREHAEHDAARVGELAERYLGERAAAILLTRAIEHHREHSARPILERAQALLPLLTANSLTRLFIDEEDGDHPVIMARRANGGELGVSGMSDGTLDQLYLALRLAALEHHLDALPPLPVLLDDIFVNYDEPRVATSAPALAEIAKRTQVIVLTHHEHVATIAQDVLGDRVRVHRLGAVSTA